MKLAARLMTWNRAREDDVEASLACGIGAVDLSIPVSDLHITKKLRRDRAWVRERLLRTVAYAREEIYVCAGLEDASRADKHFSWTGGDGGRDATGFGFCDTAGLLDPFARSTGSGGSLRPSSSVEITRITIWGRRDNALAGVRAGAAFVSVT
jgi:homocitrate synthase NifV